MAELWRALSEQQMVAILLPIGVAVLVTVLALVLRSLLYRWLTYRAERTRSQLDDAILHAIRRASLLWCFIAGIYFGVRASALPEPWVALVGKVLASLLLISMILVVGGIASGLIARYTTKAGMSVPMTGLVQKLVRVLVLGLGVFVLLDTLGVEITSLIAALGIGSLAVALALQDTLSNLFAGGYIILSKNIRPGDYIKVDSGVEGYVVDIGWRATTIRPFDNNIVIMPNSKLSQSVVTNTNLPEPWMQLAIPINVSYDTDIEKLERVLVEEGKRALQEVPGMVTDFEPVVRFMPGFGDFSLNFVFVFRVKQFVDQYFAQHELRKRILKRFRQEGIEIPFPIRTVRLTNQAEAKGGIDADYRSGQDRGTIS